MTRSTDPFRDRTEGADGTFPENWPRPEPGDYIIGEVTSIELSAGKYEQPVLGVQCEDKQREYSVWLPQYIRDDIVSLGLKVGERVSIKYYGLKKSRSGREYQHFGLMIDPQSRIVASEPKGDPHRTQKDSNPATDPSEEGVEYRDSPAGGGYDDGLPF